MPPPPAARDKVLDAFERLLIERGERETTLDAVAREAGVSKGGLIYHFNSRDALVDGLLERLQGLVEQDIRDMTAAPGGPVAYYLSTSANPAAAVDRTLVAATRLLQRSHTRVGDVLAAAQQRWYDAVLAAVGDPAVARLIVLLGDGMYYESTMAGSVLPARSARSEETVQQMLGLVDRLLDGAGER
ncbi:TetR/AcrR family transcriptional regulator [Nakamurella flava]|uniref:TetR/AcrR family transcriptional regulator n=1 Tax=Nakamurella flava TaxID=2576308 RepID=A0A4U6Q919_9ACTN|nr:TetR/AcrR family transcriptional regulator [Nakamurella flava]TKV56373.1 TetR/AcrR family transcriptional regulator [Nakamurella flava]